jgi:hypothetical protein
VPQLEVAPGASRASASLKIGQPLEQVAMGTSHQKAVSNWTIVHFAKGRVRVTALSPKQDKISKNIESIIF